MDREAIEEIVARYFEGIEKDVVAVYLFGSVARGEERSGSDVDIGVLYRDTPAPTFEAAGFDHAANLAQALGREIDLITMNDAPPELVHRILRDARLVLEKDASRRVAFEVRSRNEYFDVLPVLKEYRRAQGSGR